MQQGKPSQFVCLRHFLSGRKLCAGFRLFTCTLQSRCQAPEAQSARQHRASLTQRAASPPHRNIPRAPAKQVVLKFAVCMSNSPSEISPNIHLVFILQGAVPRKGNTKPPTILTASQHPLLTETPRAPWTL